VKFQKKIPRGGKKDNKKISSPFLACYSSHFGTNNPKRLFIHDGHWASLMIISWSLKRGHPMNKRTLKKESFGEWAVSALSVSRVLTYLGFYLWKEFTKLFLCLVECTGAVMRVTRHASPFPILGGRKQFMMGWVWTLVWRSPDLWKDFYSRSQSAMSTAYSTLPKKEGSLSTHLWRSIF